VGGTGYDVGADIEPEAEDVVELLGTEVSATRGEEGGARAEGGGRVGGCAEVGVAG
jgi:hypothetical protein